MENTEENLAADKKDGEAIEVEASELETEVGEPSESSEEDATAETKLEEVTENSEEGYLNEIDKESLLKFLTDQQYKEVHPYTNAAPGGWAWSPLPGAVPDADDTSGALVALRRLTTGLKMPVKEAEAGIGWLSAFFNGRSPHPARATPRQLGQRAFKCDGDPERADGVAVPRHVGNGGG